MYEKPRGAFETLTQRMADACLATMPGFGPAPEAPADEAAQRLLAPGQRKLPGRKPYPLRRQLSLQRNIPDHPEGVVQLAQDRPHPYRRLLPPFVPPGVGVAVVRPELEAQQLRITVDPFIHLPDKAV